MKKTIDANGRLVIPKFMFDKLGLNNGDEVEVVLNGNPIEITNPKYESIQAELLTNLKLLQNKYHDQLLSNVIDMVERL
jgi:AbrB family looped-hinge helix DNA binding protein